MNNIPKLIEVSPEAVQLYIGAMVKILLSVDTSIYLHLQHHILNPMQNIFEINLRNPIKSSINNEELDNIRP